MPSAEEILKKYWGYDGFRPLQKDIIDSVLTDNDTFALLPTGGGKSVCYQVPALMLDGCCLVISPLIALMQDQVNRLQQLDIPAASIHSGMYYNEVRQTLENAISGDYKLLYVSPERLQTDLFQDYMYKLDVSLIAVDEAHCVSQWGHDFRPDYLKIAELRSIYKRTPVLALTATATEEIQQDIALQLKLKKPNYFKQSFARQNIFYEVRYSENKNRDTEDEIKDCSIVYCRSRKQTEATGRHLQQHGINTAVYHAGMTKPDRDKAQEEWMADKAPVIVATTAFGMGIDKPDVRTVLHYDAPEHLEAWYQEAGRAGRDGKKSFALTLYNSVDIKRLSESTALQFPPESFMKKVYQGVAEYLQIPIGCEPHKYYSFDISDFCDKFSLQLTQVIYAMKLLEREGLWAMTEAVHSPSTVHFITDRHVLDNMATSHPKMQYIAVGLLRMYNTIFHFPTHIREFAIARQLRLQYDEVVHMLGQMHRMGLIEYNKAGDGPQLFFHHTRVDSAHLLIDLNRIHVLRKRHELRTEKMLAFLYNKEVCRERVVLQYFGEVDAKDCGHCDVCKGERAVTTGAGKLKEQLFRTLMAGSKTLAQLTQTYDAPDKHQITELVRGMMDEGVVIIGDDGVVRYKK
ncbi:RecQ family ATP-dependent DNA helicase [Flavipsychrobacter stenotrophus]|uniref:ATP-dependent DNA helicase RecQ n=1 Tax=Flavipsychrobacter stenotrophus TaxID=2077091 RepID=A0A2S7T0E8_9BACT|nr:ATP-dependent DNA helicase RecQ [Flavipsychrobacter stenotrophus]PQJ12662.1 RecQ family ATP-dependent DNA helicase [Flavipsychrobacter stenotrophus]